MKRTERRPIFDTWQPMPLSDVLKKLLHPTTIGYQRTVHDGYLRVLVSHEPKGWHLSISHVKRFSDDGRYPSWDEIANARYKLVPDDVTMAMLLPPSDQYVNLHERVFHLHEIPTENPFS